ncbi:MAG: MBL fold metallo-hydrolase [Candidatus Micrarchaeota archaeon]
MKKITRNIFSLELPEPSSNAYVLMGDSEAALIDPGLCSEKQFDAALASAGLSKKDVSRIFLTHAHADHASNARFLPNAVLRASRDTLGRLRRKHPEAFFTEFGVHFFEVPKAEEVVDGQSIKFSGFDLLCLRTPGHVPDSTCFFEKKSGILFSGDSLFPTSLTGSVPRVFYPEGGSDLLRSWQKLEKECEQVEVLAPGHGPVSKEFERDLELARRSIAGAFL